MISPHLLSSENCVYQQIWERIVKSERLKERNYILRFFLNKYAILTYFLQITLKSYLKASVLL